MLLSTDPSPHTLPRTAAPRAATAAWAHGRTCAPRTVAEIVALVNWARRNGWKVRAAGICDGLPPPTPSPAPARTLLLDLSRHMHRSRIDGARTADAAVADTVSADAAIRPGAAASVTALTGITMQSLLARLEQAGYGLTSCPAFGDMTLAEALAIGACGTAIPADGETRASGHTYGSLSNLIISLTAIVWDATQQAYVARTVRRTDPRMGALLVHHGRALIVAATLRVGPLQHLRCVSRTDLSAATVFAPPATAGPHSFAASLGRCGRIESLWFAFTPAPWLKTWSVAPERPATSREAEAPHNYPFTNEIGDERSALIRELAEGNTWVTPLFTGLSYASVVAGLLATASVDLWGTAKNTQLYSQPSPLRVTSSGYVVLTTRNRVQHVVSTFYDYLSATLERYRAEGRFPVNGPWEARVSGLDDPVDCGIADAQPALLSVTRPHADRAYDTAVWLSVHTLTGTADSQRFYAELDTWIHATFTGPDEWVRRAPSPTAATTTSIADHPDLDPAAWAAASRTLHRLDPHHIYNMHSRTVRPDRTEPRPRTER